MRYKKDTSIDGHPILDTLADKHLSKDQSIVALNNFHDARSSKHDARSTKSPKELSTLQRMKHAEEKFVDIDQLRRDVDEIKNYINAGLAKGKDA